MSAHPESPRSIWLKMDSNQIDMFCNPLEHIREHGWHESTGSECGWDVERLVEEQNRHLIYSSVWNHPTRNHGLKKSWRKLVFRLSEKLYYVIEFSAPRSRGRLTVWAEERDVAESEFSKWWENYSKKPGRVVLPSEFHIVTLDGAGDPDTRAVELEKRFLTKEHELGSHYGMDFPEWSEGFLYSLRRHHFGVSILQGEPGTGKTSFIRFLIKKLKRSHRFYYIPAEYCGMLTSPKMVDFWARQHFLYGKHKKVAVLEDAESLLTERTSENRHSLANLLNIADGLLGEFLRMQLICTVNCGIEKLDPAIARSGRLLSYRKFRRLQLTEAQALASSKGFVLPDQEDYSLAEIYHGQNISTESRRQAIGFH